MSGTLYLCPTPIGNLEDITFRVISTLKSVDLIAAEDTRHTIKLLNHFEINTPLTSYYEHNKRHKGTLLLDRLLRGENIAIVSDAGTPGISDPGEDMVRLCVENEIEVIALPGATAVTVALTASGLPTGRFAFEGFLTTNKKNRRAHLEGVKDDTRTLIFYEAPHKLKSTLADMLEAFGDRDIVIARELTKKFEEVNRTTITAAIEKYEEVTPKGEFVLVIEGFVGDGVLDVPIDQSRIESELKRLIEQGLSGNEAAKVIAKEYSLPKREVYAIYLEISKD
ncbi:MAG: 16S rRNA (cytidine(1402)-2'-O)-methyltransferase [Oscillospiraceae bacterium]|nr:16S rRNA (cytidine(1402)-2'-O)-methyltransferase [Oscillospiraceae bacterium]